MKSQGHLAFSFAATGRVVLTVGLWLAVVGQIAPAQTTITVGQDGGYDHETIQAGIDTATTGDTVLVYPGTYVENTKFNGKDIILRSAEPTSPAVVASTIIDGNLSGSVVTFAGSETSDCVLSGFTITNGRAGSAGGILGNNTLATVENCVISSNSVLGRFQSGSGLYKCDGTIRNNMITGNAGNGLFECDGTIRNNSISRNAHGGLYDCDGTIRNNTISGNSAAADGGGLCECDGMILNNTISGNSTAWSGGGLAWCDGTIVNNTISGNSAAAYGGGLFWCDGTIVNNTISGNSAAASGGGLHRCNGMIVNNTISGNSAAAYGGGLYRCNGMIRNCIVWGNTQSTGPQLNSCVTPSYCCIQNWSGGGDGNFPLDPRLSDDFHLLPDSPCIDAGGRVALTQDFEGDPRPHNATTNIKGDGSDIDVGADEFFGSAAPNVPPDQPDNVSPSSGASNISLLPTLAGATFVDRDTGDVLGMSRWQVRSAGRPPDYSDAVFDSAGPAATSFTLPAVHVLDKKSSYFWRVRYADNHAAWSSWSNETQFTTRDVTTLTAGQGGGYDYATIQAAIDAATTGDTVLVYPGTYIENIHFKGKGIVLRSTDPTSPSVVDATTIDGNKAGPVATFAGTETSSCVLSGLTIINGRAASGGGISGNGTLATVENCAISSNSAIGEYQHGGGLFDCDGTIRNNTIYGNAAPGAYSGGGGLAWCDGTILNNTITSNSARWSGGGLADCDGTILNNTITNNSAGSSGGGLFYCGGTIWNNAVTDNSARSGGGLAWCDGTILNNTIRSNSATWYGGGLADCDGTIRNCIIWRNHASFYAQLYRCSIPSHCCIYLWSGTGFGNIGDDPLFTNGPLGSYYLSQTAAGQAEQSPCVNAGSGTASALGLTSATTRIDGVGDWGTVDMGYHYLASLPPLPQFALMTAVYPIVGGTVTPSGVALFDAGTTFAVTAIPNTWWLFDHWSGDVMGNENPVVVTMETTKTVAAHFVRIRYPLTTKADPPKGGRVVPAGSFTLYAGTTVPVTAIPNDRWAFDHWGGDATGSMNPTIVTMDTTKTVTAHFVAVPGPDLAGRLDGVTPNTIVCGQPVSFQGAVSNAGDTASTSTFWVEFWAVNVQTGQKVFLCDSLNLGPLNPGESFSLADVTPARMVYDNIPAGTYAIEMRIDATNAVAESCETNNVTRSEKRTILPNQPDLAVAAFDFSPQDVAPKGGTAVSFSGTVVNRGSQPTTGSFWIEFRVWPEPAFKPTGPFLCDSLSLVTPLKPGESFDLGSFAPLSYELESGIYYVGIAIDATNGIAEQREDNNVTWLTHKKLYVGPRPTGVRRSGWWLYR